MVNGIERFRDAFSPFREQFVLIGGTAADLAMKDAGLAFRATKDLDIVLHVESLTAPFGKAFWAFVEAGGYATRETSEPQQPRFYRFQKPKDATYPAMLELFARAPQALQPVDGAFTPIPLGESIASLSAILLDDDYYRFTIDGRRDVDGLPCIGADRLIPLKACAFLDLSERRARGEAIDEKQVRKHRNDVFRLSQLLVPAMPTELGGRIDADFRRFVDRVREGERVDPRALEMGPIGFDEVVARLSQAFVRRARDP